MKDKIHLTKEELTSIEKVALAAFSKFDKEETEALTFLLSNYNDMRLEGYPNEKFGVVLSVLNDHVQPDYRQSQKDLKSDLWAAISNLNHSTEAWDYFHKEKMSDNID